MSYLLVFDGGEGAGKSTQLRMLKERWDDLFPGQKAIFTREPGGSPFAERIRELVLSEAGGESPVATQFCLMAAARFEHLDKVILPHLAEGTVVICDRFESTTFAYQLFAAGSTQLQAMYDGQKQIVSDLLDGRWRTIIMDMSPATGLARVANRRGEVLNHFDRNELGLHERRRDGFLEYVRLNPHVSLVSVDEKSPEEVHELLVGKIREILATADEAA